MEPRIIEKELRHKIEKLMEYRMFPLLFGESDQSDTVKEIFYNKLIDLQFAIYILDAHLESNWEVNTKTLYDHWANIAEKLIDCDVKNDDTGAYLSHIRKYEKHELELRLGKSPLRFDMEYFYFYKSCDVKLLRRLIYEKFGLSKSCGTLSDWRYFDLITEVNDDIEDLEEDLQFINGNRFMIHLLHNGIKETAQNFSEFMNQIKVKATNKALESNHTFSKIIYENTILQLEATSNLMTQTLDELDLNQLKHSKLIFHLSTQMI